MVSRCALLAPEGRSNFLPPGWHGVVQPLPVQTAESGEYLLVAGERRLHAAQQAGIEKLPVIILDGERAKWQRSLRT
jgi:hypothetical protein